MYSYGCQQLCDTMILVYIFWGHYDGFQAVLECAKRNALCPIYVISNGAPVKDAIHFPISDFDSSVTRLKAKCVSLTPPFVSVLRWFVLQTFCERMNLRTPIFCSDWDVMLFRPLAESYAPFRRYDYTVSINRHGDSSAAYGIGNLAALNAFCTMIHQLIESDDLRARRLHDMEAWRIVTATNKWNVGDLFQTTSGSVFDHNITQDGGRFVMDGKCKKVVWKGSKPHFVQVKDGMLIRANSIHCWGPYKSKPAELLARSMRE